MRRRSPAGAGSQPPWWPADRGVSPNRIVLVPVGRLGRVCGQSRGAGTPAMRDLQGLGHPELVEGEQGDQRPRRSGSSRPVGGDIPPRLRCPQRTRHEISATGQSPMRSDRAARASGESGAVHMSRTSPDSAALSSLAGRVGLWWVETRVAAVPWARRDLAFRYLSAQPGSRSARSSGQSSRRG
jgi:hypothetical protein